MIGVTVSGCTVVPGMHMPREITKSAAQNSLPASMVIQEIDQQLLDAGTGTQMHAQRIVAEQLLGSAPDGYVIGPGDVLQITVWDHPELAAGLGAQPATQPRQADAPAGIVVGQEGSIEYPYAGRVKAAGLTTDAIRNTLSRRLGEYFNSPQVTVRVASYRSKQVFIDGEVHSPGVQQINDIPMTLMDAISRAGGFTDNADQGRVLLTRGGKRYVVSIGGLVSAGYDPSAIYLRNRDLLRVPTRSESGVYVMGEVSKPMTALPEPDGTLTLADALSQAGSFNLASSDPRQMYVIRKEDGQATVFHLDARSPVAMVMANRFGLLPGDVVYVGSTDLTAVYRVLSQLLPAVGAGLTAAVVAK
ncbi:polysaccharide biosynthesis/export family protein [Caballeronia zhejiangensis]|uniref:polysaccharide biosynthesis/export family protein n=1 Tax=Caballeronia zhejiangensis TaxID=871203 RepID=UPI001F520753|nr:polysaccharide biosynthesis/export family protein [Caballeronia zhejiangensis]MCI1046999.1 polysaccharide biosynthesis/export family protein [Caballeronia zhejiangensis]